MSIKVVLVDEHAILREGLASLINRETDMKVVGEASNGIEALQMTEELIPDVVLIDIQISGLDGIETIRRIREKHPPVSILVLTLIDQDKRFHEAIYAGATGYLLKTAPSSDVIEGIRLIFRGGSVLDPVMARKLLDNLTGARKPELRKSTELLTPRELDVLKLMVKGLSNKEMAENLFISDKTVKIHVSNILKKLRVKSRSQAIIYAVQHGLVELE